jgi:phosphate butyryltransferase
VAVFNDPVSGRLLLLTDAGVNISPNIYRKIRIVKNAVQVARSLGIETPRVALLAAIDTLNYPAMQATLDAALVSKMARDGMVEDAFVEGPFALDNAVSPDAAKKKGIGGEVAGRADILVAQEIETANVLYKSLQFFSNVTFASVVVGASSPIAVPSRVDSPSTKLMSVALTCLLA